MPPVNNVVMPGAQPGPQAAMPDLANLIQGIEGALNAGNKEDFVKDGDEMRAEELEEQKKVQYDLDKAQKQELVEYIKKLIDECKVGRTEWEDNLKEAMDLHAGVREPKSDPWPNCSNVTTMATATHVKLMHSKLFPAVWNENMVYWRPVSADDIENAENVGDFMKWVVRQEMQLGDEVDDYLYDLIVTGTIALKIRWDVEYRTVRAKDSPTGYKEIARERAFVENIPIDEVYLPSMWLGENQSEYIGQDVWKRIPEIEALRERGHFVCTDEDMEKLKAHVEDQMPEGIRKHRNDYTGIAQYNAFVSSYPIRLIECYTCCPLSDYKKDSVFVIAYDAGVYMSGKPLTAVSPTGNRPWVIGQFIRRPGSPYGVGLPEIMKGLAAELDAIHNQRIDAGSVTIAPFGFYRAASSFKPEKVQIGPGTMIPVDDIKDVNVVQFQGNLATSFQEERIIIEYMEKLTATSAYQMGRESDIVKSRATATGTMAIIQQGEQAYTLLGIRTQRIISKMLTKVLQMYQAFMPSGLADRILGEEPGELLFENGLDIEDIAGGYDAYMALDAVAGSKQMERQANAVMVQMASQLLAMAQDPRGYAMAEDFLKSIGKIDVEKYLGPKPRGSIQGGAAGLNAFTQPPMGPGMENVAPQGAPVA